ncbi:hypothetical protein NQ176_g11269 [Zarea fungicola]|uniref:Uncharacterized protein n=1 Tax=Zarea fungicola TaxID=93591 RepID=A0ACC1MC00_9HYPO|nr:hypothetical protein NQ176_g11269 [Lecanicillium fungicola]
MISSHILQVVAVLATVCGHAVGQEQSSQQPLPIVDLGYELHQANNFNQQGGYYNFTDIRFGAPPLDKLRFAKPQPPAVNRSEVQQGGQGYVCPQAIPRWLQSEATFLSNYLTGGTSFAAYNASSPVAANSSTVQVSDRPGLTVTEDCLFLDVIVPRNIFERAGKGYGAPVMVWIYGGGELPSFLFKKCIH